MLAIRSIKQVNEFTAATPLDMNLVVQYIAGAVASGYEMPPVPPVTASRGNIGEFYSTVRYGAVAAAGLATCPHVVLEAVTMQTENDLRGFIGLDPGMGDLVKAMVQAWRDDAGQWQIAREESARRQMGNDGETAEVIAALLADPARLRQWIQHSRADLIATLTEALAAVNANDPLHPSTSKQRELLAKHVRWFPDNVDDDEEFYPNDSAVDYFFMVTEIMVLLHRVRECGMHQLMERFHYFCRVAGAHLTNESISKGYAAMSGCGGASVNGVDISGVIRAYSADPGRNGTIPGTAGLKKHLPSQQRSPLRLLRIVAVGSMHQNAFQILNMEGGDQVRALVRLSRLEAAVKAAIAGANNIAPGEDGLMLSHTMLWLVVAGRSNIFAPIYGRNDVAVPAIAAAVTAMPPDGLTAVLPRPWAFTLTFDLQVQRFLAWQQNVAHVAAPAQPAAPPQVPAAANQELPPLQPQLPALPVPAPAQRDPDELLDHASDDDDGDGQAGMVGVAGEGPGQAAAGAAAQALIPAMGPQVAAAMQQMEAAAGAREEDFDLYQ
jgi:hypothetical protein